ncbi:MAG: D-cysteine desulfhydrase family protein [Planctomycetaceae bacterium]|jgi:1-aminocyclopropane-1-carboxylate deaminase/D-cysteine desulfhydrase-like pyridoxal-dependent ACC family enzyme
MATRASLSTPQLRAHVDRLPRYLLGHYPTPLEYCPRLTALLGGPKIYIKRDDCTGLAMGGNKTRHNEFLIADALRKGADLLVWGAGIQSNNCRQTAAACARAGLQIHLVLGRGGPAQGPDPIQGNLLLDYLVGAQVDIVEEKIGPDLDARITRETEAHRARGRKVYGWDKHICKPLAAVSYLLCVAEIVEQGTAQGFTPRAIYTSSAGSTGAGVALAQKALGLDCAVHSVAPIQWPYDTQADMAEIAQQAGLLVGLDLGMTPADIDVRFDCIGPGYGKLSEGGIEAIETLARTEGILLDPMYSGKAMAGLMADVRAGRYRAGESIVLIHTGGTPALFAYADGIVGKMHPRRIS